jgi:hypothetical protein
MVAFIIAGIVALLSLALGLLGLFASGMSDAPGQTSGVAPYVIGGLIVAALIAASHFLPHMSW